MDPDVVDWRGRFEELQKKYAALQDECDLLAEENARLRSAKDAAGPGGGGGGGGEDGVSPTADRTGEDRQADAGEALSEIERRLGILATGSGRTSMRLVVDLPGACGGANVCSTAMIGGGDGDGFGLVLAGGANGVLHGYAPRLAGAGADADADADADAGPPPEGKPIVTADLGVPVLRIAHARLGRATVVALGLMDGAVALLRVADDGAGRPACELLARKRLHRKAVTSVALHAGAAGDRAVLASGSYDHSATLQAVEGLSGGGSPAAAALAELRRFHFGEAVEAVRFDAAGGGGRPHLLIAARGEYRLHRYDVETFGEGHVSLNDRAWDTHRSCNAMDVACNGAQPTLLAVATDNERHIVLDTRSRRILRTLAGHSADGFSSPRVGWHACGRYLSSNSQGDHAVYTWELASARVAHRAQAHRSAIRDLELRGHAAREEYGQRTLMATASFDKSVRLWEFGRA